eukprot:g2006.t1
MRFSIGLVVVVLVILCTSTDAALRSRKRSKRSQPIIASNAQDSNFVTVSTSDDYSEKVDTVTPHIVATSPAEGKLDIKVEDNDEKSVEDKMMKDVKKKFEKLEAKIDEQVTRENEKPVNVNVEVPPAPTPEVHDHDQELMKLQEELQRTKIDKIAAEKRASMMSASSSSSRKVEHALAELASLKTQIQDQSEGGTVAIKALKDENGNLKQEEDQLESEITDLKNKIRDMEKDAEDATANFKAAAEKMGEEMMAQEKKDIEEALRLLRDAYDAKIGAINGSLLAAEQERDNFKEQVLNLAAKMSEEHAASQGSEAASIGEEQGDTAESPADDASAEEAAPAEEAPAEEGGEAPAEEGAEETPAEEGAEEAPAEEGAEEAPAEEAPAEEAPAEEAPAEEASAEEGGEEAPAEEGARFKETRASVFAKSRDFFDPKVKHDPAI